MRGRQPDVAMADLHKRTFVGFDAGKVRTFLSRTVGRRKSSFPSLTLLKYVSCLVKISDLERPLEGALRLPLVRWTQMTPRMLIISF